MQRVIFCSLALAVSVLSSNVASAAEHQQLALAPIPVVKEDQVERPKRMISILEERIRKLKADGNDDQAKEVIKRAHMRVRKGREQLDSQAKELHKVVEKIGKGDEVDLEKTELPMFEKEIRKLQKATRRLVKDGKKDEAAKQADELHKKIRESIASRGDFFAEMHEAIEAVGKKKYAAADEHGEDGHGEDEEHHRGKEGDRHDDDDDHEEHGEHHDDSHGEDGEHGKDGHDGDHRHAHGDHDEHHADDHDHDGELEELHEEIEEIRDEIEEIRDLIRQLRRKLK